VCKDLKKLSVSKAQDVAQRTERGDWGLSDKEEREYEQREFEMVQRLETICQDIKLLATQFRNEKSLFLTLLQDYSRQYSSYAQLHFLLL
jgi:hypothetical protein